MLFNASLMFRELPEISVEALCAAVGGQSLRYDPLPDVAGAVDRVGAKFDLGLNTVWIELCARPVPAKRLETALRARYARAVDVDFETLVTDHQCEIRLRVTDELHRDRPALAQIEKARAAQDPVLPRMLITQLHTVLQALLAQCEPMFIHWRQSDMVFLPSETRACAGWTLPLPLMVRPQLLDGGYDSQGNRAIGLELIGSERLLGARLVIEPCARRVPKSLAFGIAVMHEIIHGRLVPRHGQKIETPTLRQTYVRRDPGRPQRIVLTETQPLPQSVDATAPAAPTKTNPTSSGWLSRKLENGLALRFGAFAAGGAFLSRGLSFF
ncbi:MAG: hypothetical protein MK160_08915 [Rhodobacteraceae bacterium]|nr:hypothetical protein [Paracoccaceae bacterium]